MAVNQASHNGDDQTAGGGVGAAPDSAGASQEAREPVSARRRAASARRADPARPSSSARHADPAPSSSVPRSGSAAGRLAGVGRSVAGYARSRVNRRRMPLWATVMVLVALAVLAEVFLFNFRHWQSLGYEETVLRDEPIKVSKSGYSVGIGSLDLDVKNIAIEVSGPPDNSPVWLSVQVSDDGDSSAYYLPVTQSHQSNGRSQVHTVFTYGHVHSIKVSVPGDVWGGVDSDVLLGSNSFPVTIQSISVNARVPLYFSWLRLVLAFAFGALVWFLWPGRALSRIPALSTDLGPTLARTGVLAGTVTGLLIFCLAIPRWAGFATSWYNTINYDAKEGGAYQITGQPDTATNEYGKLAQAFANGQIDLLQTPPQWLQQMDDPYMYGARSEESSKHVRGYLWDTAYYDGAYYVYFGVLPVLVFYLPFFLMTGEYLPNSIPIIATSVLFAVGWYALLRAMVRHKFKKTSLATFILIYLGVLASAGLLFGLGRAGLYNVPVTCARCLAIWALYLWYRGWHLQSPVRLCAGSLLAALIAATRPQLLVVLPLLAIPVFLVLRARGMGRRRKAGWLACMVVPVVLVAAGVMWYNYARFDSPFDFGATYNLTYNNMTMRGSSLMRVADGLYYCLVNPPTITDTFPFISHAAIYPAFSGTTIYEPLMGGIVWLNPMLLAIGFVFSLLKKGRRDASTFWMAGYLAAVGLILVAFDTNGAGILLRYFQDYGFLLGLSAALIFLYHLGGEGARLPRAYEELAERVNSDDHCDHAAKSDEETARVLAATAGEATLAAMAGAGERGAAAGASQQGAAALMGVVSDEVARREAAESAGGQAPAGRRREEHPWTRAFREGGARKGLAVVWGSVRASLTGWEECDVDTLYGDDCPRRPTWGLALFFCVLAAMVMTVMAMLFMMNPIEGNVSGGGSYPAFWESLRQTFQFWL